MILGEQPIVRIRYATITVGTDGRAALGAATSTTIMASVQPATGRQLFRLPEGERQSYPLALYTETEVRTADQSGQVPADRITYGGATFIVGRVSYWPSFGPLPHYEALLMRQDESGGAP